MKTHLSRILIPALLVCLVLCLVSCDISFVGTDPLPDVWDNALYTEDTALGEGELTFTLKVKAADRTVTFTVSTDCTVLGDALLACELVEGDEGAYGLYITHVNGMEAKDSDKAWWCLYEGDTMAATGADGITLTEGAEYTLAYEFWG